MQIRNLALGLMFAVAASATADTVFFSGSLTTDDPTFNRPLTLTDLSAVGTDVYYDVQDFFVSQDGSYTLSIVAPDEDTYLALYSPSLDPSSPLTNLVGLDDDSGDGLNSLLTIDLMANTNYQFVVTSFENGDTFDYRGVIEGPGDITLDAVPEPASMAALGLGALALLRRRRKN